MVCYICKRCGYIGTQKSNIKNHLNRKNICLPLLEDISIEEMKKMYGFINSLKTLKNPPKPSKNPPKSLQNPSEINFENSLQNPPKTLQNPPKTLQNPPKTLQNDHTNAYCEYCLREFTRRDNLARHYGRCKIKKNLEENEKKMEKNDEKNKINNEKQIESFKDTVEDLLVELSNKNTTIYNTTHNMTTHKNKIINIHINNYGNENTGYLKKDYLNNLLQGAFTAIPKLIEKIHFNPNHPENHNIKITNKKEPYIKVRKNDKWELHDKKETLETLVDDKYYILENHYSGVEEEKDVSIHTKEVMEKFRDKFNEDKELHKDLQKKSEMVILNNS